MQVNSPQFNSSQVQPTGLFISIGMLLIGLWGMIFWPTLVSMENVWRGSETYMHCYFIPAISAWLIWPYRKAINTTTFGSPRGFICLIPSLLIWLIGFASDINLIAHFGVMFCLISLVWCWLGDENFKLLRFPLLYLLFAVPFGDEVNPPLQFITAEMAVWLLQLTGIPVLHEGLYITTPVGAFEVAEACSGVRFMIVALALAFLFSHLHFRSWKKRAIFIASLSLLSIIANSFRAYFLIFLGEKTNMAYGFGADHYYYGWAFFAIVIFISFQVGARFADSEEKISEVKSSVKKQKFAFPLLSIVLLTCTHFWLVNLATNTQTQSAPMLQNNSFGIKFANATQLNFEPLKPNVAYFFAAFAMKQANGELISSSNQLYASEIWTTTETRIVQVQDSLFMQKKLQHKNGRIVDLIYTYQIADINIHSNFKAKFLQAFYFLLGSKDQAKIHAIYCENTPIAECHSALRVRLGNPEGTLPQ